MSSDDQILWLTWSEGEEQCVADENSLKNSGEAHLAIEFFHGHQIQRFERVSRGSDEVQACVDAGVVVAM